MMTIQTISRLSVALYITPADLSEHGLTPGTLTVERAVALAREAFAEAGIEPEGGIEIEAFPDSCGVLVFARVRPREEVCFAFEDSESLVRAAQMLSPLEGEGSLCWWEERYWLWLPGHDRAAAAVLSEFGQEAAADPWLAQRLAEHGAPILSGDVIGALKEHFAG